MAKHSVKCRTCGASFDTNEQEFVKFGRQYYHKQCFWLDNEAIKRGILYLCEKLFGEQYNKYKINHQIKTYISQGIEYKDILKTLQYWYLIKKNDISKANGGIGIVGYIYQEANSYYNTQQKAKIAANDADVETILNPKIIEFKIKPKSSHMPKGMRTFKME